MDSLSLELTGGFRIVVPADPRRLSTHVFLEQEDWFEDEAPFIRALIAPGERVLDIGANLGFYSLTAARAAGPEGRVWSFEPTADIAQRLRESAALNGFATLNVVEMALGDARGEAFLGRGENDELNRIVATAAQGVAVRMERLDDWSASEPDARGIGFVKLDVEGHEAAVIAGGLDFFARESPLVMLEITDGQAVRDDALQRLRDIGYESYRLLPEPNILVPFSGPRPDSGVLNLFAAKPNRAERLAARGLLARSLPPPMLAEPGAVEAFLIALPALAPHREDMRRAMARLLPEGPYAAALRGWLASRDATVPAAVRAASLNAAFEAVRAALAERVTASRLLTAGRIARATGRRSLAAEAAQQIVRTLLDGRPMTLGEPFVPLLPFYENWASPAGLTGWVGAMAIEAYWRWASFSTYFNDADFGRNDPVDLLRRYGREAAFFERRRQLQAMWHAPAPAPHALLTRRTADNLNPEFWTR